jgi:hypothetical protein
MIDDTMYLRIVETLLELGDRAEDPPAKTLREVGNVLMVRREGGMIPATSDERRFPRRIAA